MEAAGTCEIARLPEELLSAALALTTPRDACRAAAVSRDFHASADSDAVWSRFLPRDPPPLADGELSGPAPPSEKGRFLRLCDRPVLLADGLMSMWLDRETGAKCYMLSARALRISWGDTPEYWRWMHPPESRFMEVAELQYVWWLEIRGMIHSKMLSQDSTYAAYIVFKTTDRRDGLDYPPQEASITVAGSTSTHKVCLQSYDNEHEDGAVPLTWRYSRRHRRVFPGNLVIPQRRTDDWMELEMGQFYNKDGDDGEVCISLMETKAFKRGLIVQGIEIRPKRGHNTQHGG
ncbi:F-box protein PP2-B11 isoform X2 [Setaria italica]|uniref:F-box protein PP2-B11 isoform X2 n=1 Tax=Setaria italica TaxID=4555 RepID=UPI000350854B|nr:F-box protein PP2-B11 isoform X2 [Setaria italica]